MACLAHMCLQCNREWLDNDGGARCPGCGSGDVVTDFDEPMEEHADVWDDDVWEDDE